VRNLRRLSNTARPSSIAATMVAKLSSSRMMSADSLATSVPEMPIAMPTSAHFSAGASFTPSPVTATISPLRCKACTMRIFCSALVRAKISSGSCNSKCKSVFDISCSLSPLSVTGFCASPISRASAMAVCG